MLSIGLFLKQLFVEGPLLNYNLLPLLKEITAKVVDSEGGLNFISNLLEDTLHHLTLTEIKYKSKPKQQIQPYQPNNSISSILDGLGIDISVPHCDEDLLFKYAFSYIQ